MEEIQNIFTEAQQGRTHFGVPTQIHTPNPYADDLSRSSAVKKGMMEITVAMSKMVYSSLNVDHEKVLQLERKAEKVFEGLAHADFQFCQEIKKDPMAFLGWLDAYIKILEMEEG